MSLLDSYATANQIKVHLNNNVLQFAKISTGTKTGSVVQILKVKIVNFSKIEYEVQIKTNRSFTIRGKFMEYLDGYTGETYELNDVAAIEHHDFMGRPIVVNAVVYFPRSATDASSGTIESVLGTVKSIDPVTGHIMINPIKIGNRLLDRSVASRMKVRLAIPDRAMIVDKQAAVEVVMMKLQAH